MHVFDIVGVPAMDFWTDYEAGFVDLSRFLSTENNLVFQIRSNAVDFCCVLSSKNNGGKVNSCLIS